MGSQLLRHTVISLAVVCAGCGDSQSYEAAPADASVDIASDVTTDRETEVANDTDVPETETEEDAPPPCPPGLSMCAEGCVDTKSDPNHCGYCGRACRADVECKHGQCWVCQGGATLCMTGAESFVCANLDSDRENCGSCGAVCPAEQLCLKGACEACSATFATESGPPLIVPQQPDALFVADVNGDGTQDILSWGQGSLLHPSPTRWVSVVFGNGQMFDPTVCPDSATVNGILNEVTDLDGDGFADLVLVWGTVSVAMGNGDGTFQDQVSTQVVAERVAVGELDGDGAPDLVVSSGSEVMCVLLGNGDGTFLPCVEYDVGTPVNDFALADVDGDGALDVTTANDDETLSTMRGLGDGTFGPADQHEVGAVAVSVAVEDADGDGASDLFAIGDGWVRILWNDGGGYGPPVQYDFDLGCHKRDVAVRDFDGDAKADLLVLGPRCEPTVMLAVGDGSFNHAESTGRAFAYSMRVTDLNSDGIWDVVSARSGNAPGYNDPPIEHPYLSLSLGLGDGTFTNGSQHPTFYAIPPASDDPITCGPTSHVPAASIIARDVNGDGVLDLLTRTGTSLHLLLGVGAGAFQESVALAGGIADFAVGDLDGDGWADLVASCSGCVYSGVEPVWMSRGFGDGTFDSPSPVSLAPPPGPYGSGVCYVDRNEIMLADTNGDGALDILLNGWAPWISLGRGDGTFEPLIESGAAGGALAVADFDRNGVLDHLSSTGLFLGTGDGTFAPGAQLPLGTQAAAIDLDQDGFLDVVTTVWGEESVEVFHALGNGNFEALGAIDTPSTCASVGNLNEGSTDVTSGDFNLDGHPDIIVAEGMHASVTMLLGTGNGTLASPVSYDTNGASSAVVAADFNDDGLPDFASVNHCRGLVSVVLNSGLICEPGD